MLSLKQLEQLTDYVYVVRGFWEEFATIEERQLLAWYFLDKTYMMIEEDEQNFMANLTLISYIDKLVSVLNDPCLRKKFEIKQCIRDIEEEINRLRSLHDQRSVELDVGRGLQNS